MPLVLPGTHVAQYHLRDITISHLVTACAPAGCQMLVSSIWHFDSAVLVVGGLPQWLVISLLTSVSEHSCAKELAMIGWLNKGSKSQHSFFRENSCLTDLIVFQRSQQKCR